MNPYTSQIAPQSMQQDAYGAPQVMDSTARQMSQDALNRQGAQLGQQALGINKNPLSGIDPIKMGMALRQMGQDYGGTPQGGYGQQDAYMKYGSMNPMTQQQQMLMNQGGADMMSFSNPVQNMPVAGANGLLMPSN
jgi:hypothetical protein